MSEPVFLDTVGLIALLNKDDSYHTIAAASFERFGQEARPVATTNLVLAEFANGLSRTPLRTEACWLIRELHADRRSTVVYVDRELFDRGVELYQARGDKYWGLVDCVSFEAMRSLGIRAAFTADRHFEQAGFQLLLR